MSDYFDEPFDHDVDESADIAQEASQSPTTTPTSPTGHNVGDARSSKALETCCRCVNMKSGIGARTDCLKIRVLLESV